MSMFITCVNIGAHKCHFRQLGRSTYVNIIVCALLAGRCHWLKSTHDKFKCYKKSVLLSFLPLSCFHPDPMLSSQYKCLTRHTCKVARLFARRPTYAQIIVGSLAGYGARAKLRFWHVAFPKKLIACLAILGFLVFCLFCNKARPATPSEDIVLSLLPETARWTSEILCWIHVAVLNRLPLVEELHFIRSDGGFSIKGCGWEAIVFRRPDGLILHSGQTSWLLHAFPWSALLLFDRLCAADWLLMWFGQSQPIGSLDRLVEDSWRRVVNFVWLAAVAGRGSFEVLSRLWGRWMWLGHRSLWASLGYAWFYTNLCNQVCGAIDVVGDVCVALHMMFDFHPVCSNTFLVVPAMHSPVSIRSLKVLMISLSHTPLHVSLVADIGWRPSPVCSSPSLLGWRLLR